MRIELIIEALGKLRQAVDGELVIKREMRWAKATRAFDDDTPRHWY